MRNIWIAVALALVAACAEPEPEPREEPAWTCGNQFSRVGYDLGGEGCCTIIMPDPLVEFPHPVRLSSTGLYAVLSVVYANGFDGPEGTYYDSGVNRCAFVECLSNQCN